jgi:hypothetical protein
MHCRNDFNEIEELDGEDEQDTADQLRRRMHGHVQEEELCSNSSDGKAGDVLLRLSLSKSSPKK